MSRLSMSFCLLFPHSCMYTVRRIMTPGDIWVEQAVIGVEPAHEKEAPKHNKTIFKHVSKQYKSPEYNQLKH